MSATPEQIAEWLCDFARYMRLASPEGDPFCNARLTQAAALICAQAERVRVLEAKLEKIAGEAPAKEPSDEPTVAWPPHWSDDLRDTVNDMVLDAFRDGYTHACWRMGQIADAALAKAGAPQ